MKILVFSDTHLYLPFDQKKFNFLKKIISESDQVIINGDFFDEYMIDFEDFINSPWKQLFPLLKNKKAVYIFGNHDQKKFSDNRNGLFSILQTQEYRIKINTKTFIFTHGHQFRKTADLSIKNIKNIMPIINLIMNVAHLFRQIMTNIFGKKFLKLRFAYRNIATKREAIKTIKANEFIIIGHNHWAEVDEQKHFSCCGSILYGFAQYLIIDSNNSKISLHECWY